jgi:hypothetical protein
MKSSDEPIPNVYVPKAVCIISRANAHITMRQWLTTFAQYIIKPKKLRSSIHSWAAGLPQWSAATKRSASESSKKEKLPIESYISHILKVYLPPLGNTVVRFYAPGDKELNLFLPSPIHFPKSEVS